MTKMTLPTPGAWKIGFDKGISAGILERNPGYIAVVGPASYPFVFGGVVSLVESKANAEFIVAACNACQELAPTDPIGFAKRLVGLMAKCQEAR